MTLSEMKKILSAGDIWLAKSLGQNFLHDTNQLRRIVAAGEVGAGDRVLEIGPGLGPLTVLLLASADEVLAIEKDRRLFEILKQRTSAAKNLTLLHDDALDYVQRRPSDWEDWKLVANLPYSVASRILVEFGQMERGPRLLVATLQLEVARRLLAQAGDEDYGVLTLLVQLRYQPEGCFKIPASCFFPEPEVDSACLKLVRREEPLLSLGHSAVFSKIVKRSFSQRRKMMIKLLKQDWAASVLEKALEELGLSAQIRAEAVSLSQFVKLSQILAANGDEGGRE
jgi:16S rRNA (adenine1518-N6/adenine1519-N6)-dimethyltransferase